MFNSIATKQTLQVLARRTLATASASAPTSTAAAKPISNAAIIELEKRWEGLPQSDRQEIVSKLAERQKLPWTELTTAEKKAAWYISYGAWGPRRPIHPPGEAAKIAKGVFIGIAGSLALFLGIRAITPGQPPKTMTREWQEQSDEYLRSKNANPWSTYSQIQSK